jgi:hypothetical protein
MFGHQHDGLSDRFDVVVALDDLGGRKNVTVSIYFKDSVIGHMKKLRSQAEAFALSITRRCPSSAVVELN